MDEPSVSVVIPSLEGGELLEQCLSSLNENTEYRNMEVIVIDDSGADDGAFEFLEGSEIADQVIHNEENLGFPASANKGARAAEGEYIFVGNDDFIFRQGEWLQRLVRTLEESDEIGIVGMTLVSPDGAVADELHDERVDPDLGPSDLTVEVLEEATIGLIRRSVIERIGLFDTGFSPAYFEDNDFCDRVRGAGYIVAKCREANICHLESETMEDTDIDVEGYLYIRNEIRYTLLNTPFSGLPRKLIGLFVGRLSRCWFRKQRPDDPIGPHNIALRDSPLHSTRGFVRAWMENILNMPEIITLRRSRDADIFELQRADAMNKKERE